MRMHILMIMKVVGHPSIPVERTFFARSGRSTLDIFGHTFCRMDWYQ